MDFRGKICIVTGGARGIGKAIVEALLQRGARCLIADILFKEGELTRADFALRFGQENVIFERVDVCSQSNLETAFRRCRDHFGGVDVLVNNAGITGEVSWETMLDLNLMGTIRGTKLALRHMGRNGRPEESSLRGGVVLNVSSELGLLSWPVMPVYAAGKAAVNAYTRCIGHQLEYEQHCVKVVSLCPSMADTPLRELHAFRGITDVGNKFIADNISRPILTAEEVAEAALKIMAEAKTASVWYMRQRGEQAYEVPDQNTYENLLKWKPEKML